MGEGTPELWVPLQSEVGLWWGLVSWYAPYSGYKDFQGILHKGLAQLSSCPANYQGYWLELAIV